MPAGTLTLAHCTLRQACITIPARSTTMRLSSKARVSYRSTDSGAWGMGAGEDEDEDEGTARCASPIGWPLEAPSVPSCPSYSCATSSVAPLLAACSITSSKALLAWA